MSQVVRLAKLETGFVQKKWSESRIEGVVRHGFIHKHYVNGKNFGTGQKWYETLGGPLIEVVRKRGYTVL